MPRSRSGLACASCSSNQPDRSILGPAAIVVLLTRDPWSVLLEDHAVAVSAHDATLTSARRTPRQWTQLAIGTYRSSDVAVACRRSREPGKHKRLRGTPCQP